MKFVKMLMFAFEPGENGAPSWNCTFLSILAYYGIREQNNKSYVMSMLFISRCTDYNSIHYYSYTPNQICIWEESVKLSYSFVGILVSAKLERECGELSMLKINSRLPHSRGTLDMSSDYVYYLDLLLHNKCVCISEFMASLSYFKIT